MLVLMALVAVWAPLGAWVFPPRPLQLGQVRSPPRCPHLQPQQAAHHVPAPSSARRVEKTCNRRCLFTCLPMAVRHCFASGGHVPVQLAEGTRHTALGSLHRRGGQSPAVCVSCFTRRRASRRPVPAVRGRCSCSRGSGGSAPSRCAPSPSPSAAPTAGARPPPWDPTPAASRSSG